LELDRKTGMFFLSGTCVLCYGRFLSILVIRRDRSRLSDTCLFSSRWILLCRLMVRTSRSISAITTSVKVMPQPAMMPYAMYQSVSIASVSLFMLSPCMYRCDHYSTQFLQWYLFCYTCVLLYLYYDLTFPGVDFSSVIPILRFDFSMS
jgi:hypothetical protein